MRPVLKAGESEEDKRKALVAMVNNSAISAITLQIQEPRSRALRWEKWRMDARAYDSKLVVDVLLIMIFYCSGLFHLYYV